MLKACLRPNNIQNPFIFCVTCWAFIFVVGITIEATNKASKKDYKTAIKKNVENGLLLMK